MAMGTFTTRIRMGLGEELTLPNALVMGSVICNYSRAIEGRGYIIAHTARPLRVLPRTAPTAPP